jgi:hypothetical protein
LTAPPGDHGGRGDRAGAEAIAEIERARLRALVAADLERAGPLHADDFQLITPSGRSLSKDEYLGRIATGAYDYVHWEAGEIAVRAYGEAAVVRYPAELQITVDGTPGARVRCWHTDLYERRDGRWQCVWSQATEIL